MLKKQKFEATSRKSLICTKTKWEIRNLYYAWSTDSDISSIQLIFNGIVNVEGDQGSRNSELRTE